MAGLDDALLRFQQVGIEFAGGLANHGPMAAEALGALGHGALIEGLVDVYAPRLPPLEIGSVIPRVERVAARGNAARMPDWVATYQSEIALRPWRELLAAEVEALLPGLFAGAAHGLLRVAHAVRALDDEETDVRRRELAFGLAYWAARYQELPGAPSMAPEPGRGVTATFEAIRAVPASRRRPGLFFEAVRALDDDASFARAICAFDPQQSDVSTLLHEICRESALRYLAHPEQRIAYVHCLTAPSALRLLAHHLAPPVVGRAVGYALQAALALHAVSHSASARGPTAEEQRQAARVALDPAEIRYRAACSLEEHAIKFTEACLREHAIRPDAVFPLAAADAALQLDAGDGRGAC
jgi:hypothetical protein